MYFSRKKLLFAVGLLVLAPTLTFAQKADYLLVSAEFSGGVFGSVVAEEYAIDPTNVDLYESGTHEMRLMGDRVMLGHNFFEVPDNQEMEVIGRGEHERTYGVITPTKQNVRVALPLSVSISPKNSRIQILKNGAMLFDKTLSDLDIDIVSASTNRILIQDPPLLPLPSPSSEQKTQDGLWRTIILLVFVGGALWLYKTGKIQLIVQKLR